MVSFLPLCLLWVQGAGAAAPPGPAAAPRLRLETTQATLDNGLRVVIQPDHRAPIVHLLLLAEGGAAAEGPGESGFAHLFEHLAFEGSGGAYDRGLEALGGSSNAWTDHDRTAFLATAPRSGLDRLLELEVRRWLAPLAGIDAPILARQRDVVASEADIAADAPDGHRMDALLAAAFPPGHPYRSPVMGDPATLDAARPEALQAFYANHHGPARWILVLVGDVEAAAALAAIKARLGALPPLATACENEVSEPIVKLQSGSWMHAGPTRAPALHLVWPAPPAGHADGVALELLSRMLTQDPASEFKAMLTRGRRVDRAEAWMWQGQRGGLFVLSLSRGGRDLDRSAARLWPRLRRAWVAPVDPAALERARAAALLDRLRRWEDPATRAEALALCLSATGGTDCPQVELDRLESLDAAALEAARHRWLPWAPQTLLSTVPEGQEAMALAGARPVDLAR